MPARLLHTRPAFAAPAAISVLMACRPCGNGMAKPPEKCDGVDLAGMTCADFGFTGGAADLPIRLLRFRHLELHDYLRQRRGRARRGCAMGSIWPAGPVPTSTSQVARWPACPTALVSTPRVARLSCGNDVIEPGELCEGVDLQGLDCTDFPGFTRGTLACTMECTFDTSGCILPVCGDNIRRRQRSLRRDRSGQHWTGKPPAMTSASGMGRWRAMPRATTYEPEGLWRRSSGLDLRLYRLPRFFRRMPLRLRHPRS